MGRYPHLGTFEVEGPLISLSRAGRSRPPARGRSRIDCSATLSGGEKQRVIIASALAQISGSDLDFLAEPGSSARKSRFDPGILLLDEPTAALDLAYQLEVASLLRDLQRRTPIAIVVSTHDLNFAAGLCKTLVLLKDGGIAGFRRDRRRPDRREYPWRSTASRRMSSRMRAPAILWSYRSAGARAGRPRDDPPANRRDDNRLRRACGGGGDARAARRVDSDQSAARVRLVDAVCRQRRRADLLRRPVAAHARGRAGRRGARRRRRRLSRAAPQSARDAVHARRVLRRGARRDAGASRSTGRWALAGSPQYQSPASLAPHAPSRLSMPSHAPTGGASRPTSCCSPA